MPKKVKEPQPPKGLVRWLFRFPIFMFRLGLGSVMGQRFLLLNHTGRNSGLLRQVVLEVVHLDETTGAYFVAAGFGPRSDWYQNVLNNPNVHIQVGGNKRAVLALPCTKIEAKKILLTYARNHPRAAKALSAFMGYETDGSQEDFEALGEILKLVRLDPQS
jgi:deazaflavin-dependent oxidoreductase (nitroreductase family)